MALLFWTVAVVSAAGGTAGGFRPSSLFGDGMVMQAAAAPVGPTGFKPPPAAVVGAGSRAGTEVTLLLTDSKGARTGTYRSATAEAGAFAVPIDPTPPPGGPYTITLSESG